MDMVSSWDLVSYQSETLNHLEPGAVTVVSATMSGARRELYRFTIWSSWSGKCILGVFRIDDRLLVTMCAYRTVEDVEPVETQTIRRYLRHICTNLGQARGKASR